MNKKLKLLSIILLSIMLFFIHLTPLLASSATISVSSSSKKVVVGNTVTVTIKVKSSSYFGTIEFTPSYDKSKLKLTSGSSSDTGSFNDLKSTYPDINFIASRRFSINTNEDEIKDFIK